MTPETVVALRPLDRPNLTMAEDEGRGTDRVPDSWSILLNVPDTLLGYKPMSVVSNVVIFVDILDGFDGDFNPLDPPLSISSINTWLAISGFGCLDRLDQFVRGGGKSMQSLLYGGAFNHLDATNFFAVVKSQTWSGPTGAIIIFTDEDGNTPIVASCKKGDLTILSGKLTC